MNKKANVIIKKFIASIDRCDDIAIQQDGKLLSELIFLKYSGEDMLKVVNSICESIYKKIVFCDLRHRIDMSLRFIKRIILRFICHQNKETCVRI